MKMGKKVREYKSGDFIFAKVKGYPAWPARVQKPNGKKYFVYFYGTGETANLPPNMIFDYAENKDKFLNKSVKRKDFNDGVRQIEHDFANNVPLEQVVGALVEAEPSSADDTMNESANDTIDESAIADTTADETMDESVANAANDAPVEDSDETGALVIDEGKTKGRKSTAKTPATPKAAKEPKAPRGRPKKEENKEAKEVEDEEKKDEEIVSRSGRKIRPKRYIDEQTEENSTLPSPAPKKRRGASPSADKEKAEPKEKTQDKNIRAYNTVQQSELRELKEPFKSVDAEKENILIAYLPSGEYCGVKLFQSRPTNFKNEASRLQWDKQAASNAITLKRQLEKGQITPQSISAQLVMDLNLTSEEKATLDKDRDLEIKKSRLHFLKTEMKLIELDAKIKTCLSLEKADTELCLKLIDEILELDLAALMLLKHPTCMETVKRMRVYVGNAPSWEMSESDALTFSKQAHRIRNKADALFITMRDLFDMPDGLSFSEFFNERVAQFKAATENLHADKLLEMVHEPIEMSQPAAHTMKAAIDAANEEPAETEDTPKKKATPAKGKKVNNTPSKTPLKRQSSRKQQQEEKEKEKEKEKEPEKKIEDIPEEPDTNKTDDTDKADSNETPKEINENNDESEKTNDTEKPSENDTDEADKEVAKVNENSEKNDEKEPEEKNDGNNDGDNEKVKEDSPKEKETNSKEKQTNSKDKETNSKEKGDADISEESEEVADKSNEEKEEKSKDKESKKGKESEKNSNSEKNSKPKDNKKDEKAKEEVKNSKDGKGAKAGDKRKDKGKDDEKAEEKEKVDVDEPRAKRSRESKKTDPPPRSPAKRKSKS